MIAMSLSDAARSVDGVLAGANARFDGCSTDSRTVSRGELFVALKGPRFDGHRFLDAAWKRGASGAMTERREAQPRPLVLVDDTRKALGRLATAWRKRFAPRVVAITGSNGKTTVKEMLAAILSCQGSVLATRGNLNNEIGVPLTLFGLGPSHRFAVIEMGANHPGEIAHLCAIACPSVAVVTQCAPAHLEGFGSIEGVAKAKGEAFSSLPKDGVAVINADDDYARFWREVAEDRRCLTFGFSRDADVRAIIDTHDPCVQGNAFQLQTPSGSIQVRLQLPGRHNVMNAMAAAASAEVLGVPLAKMQEGLARVPPVNGRLELKEGLRGCRLLDDSYNANPGSFRAALAVLGGYQGKHWVVLGDMGELGADATAAHRQLGELARQAGADRLYATGELSCHAAKGFGSGARYFETMDSLIEELTEEVQEEVTLLIKGSRAAGMDAVANALVRAP